ncbi:DUF6380 family protein [Streptomyces sp. NPDC048584]
MGIPYPGGKRRATLRHGAASPTETAGSAPSGEGA